MSDTPNTDARCVWCEISFEDAEQRPMCKVKERNEFGDWMQRSHIWAVHVSTVQAAIQGLMLPVDLEAVLGEKYPMAAGYCNGVTDAIALFAAFEGDT